MKKYVLTTVLGAAVLLAFLWVATPTLAGMMGMGAQHGAAAQHGMNTKHEMGMSGSDGMMKQSLTEACAGMQARHESMMQKQGTLDARLDELLAKMRAATGSEKVPAMERLVEAMVEQRKAMMHDQDAMHMEMMSHMMAHMGSAESMGMKAASMCPMANGAGAMSPSQDSDHAQHDPK